MSSPETLLKATLISLKARIEQRLIATAAKVVVIAKDAPEKFEKEWDLFQKEVFAEADRLDKKSSEKESKSAPKSQTPDGETPQEKIDYLRAKVAYLSRTIEANN